MFVLIKINASSVVLHFVYFTGTPQHTQFYSRQLHTLTPGGGFYLVIISMFIKKFKPGGKLPGGNNTRGGTKKNSINDFLWPIHESYHIHNPEMEHMYW